MAEIYTRKGDLIVVDEDDLPNLSKYAWFIINGYAKRSGKPGTLPTTVSMHREIMGLTAGDTREVDHINGVRSDNRKSNLRICLLKENQRNRGKNRNNTSGFKGVHLDNYSGKWRAQIKIDRKRKHLGYFKTPEAAHEAYKAAAIELHGEFANSGA